MPSSHQERFKKKKKNTFLNVMFFTGGVILGSPLCFLFLLGFLGVVFPLVYIISSYSICHLYFDVWWLNLCMNPHSQYLCPTSANRAPTEHIIFNELCALKDERGPCKAIKDRFFFNVDNGRCELFEYGGCGGNANNFETLEECEETCVVSGKSDNSRLYQVFDSKDSPSHARKQFDNISDTNNLHFRSASDNVALLCICVYFWQQL